MNTISPRFLPQEQPHRKVGLFCLLLFVVIVLMKLWMWYVPGMQLLSVESGSMQPYLHKGDAVVINPLRDEDIKVGDVVSYHSPVDERVIITHRVQSYDPRSGIVVTKGDAVGTADQPLKRGRVVGRVVQRWQHVGGVADVLRSPVGLGAVLVMVSWAVVVEFRRLVAYFRPVYRRQGSAWYN